MLGSPASSVSARPLPEGVITLTISASPPVRSTAELRRLATAIRLRAVRMVAPHGFGYLGQALSAAEQYAAVYGSALRPGTDRVICSPAHYVIAAYAAAAETGLLDEAALAGYGHDGSALAAIGTEYSPVPDYTCGSLGQGLSAAAGFALADRLQRRPGPRTFAFLSDGELQEGQVWEAAMFAAHYRLGRLTVLLDANNSQVDGPVDTITTIEPIDAKWRAFGWDAVELDGHDVGAVAAALASGTDAAAGSGRPRVLVCRTSTRHGLACLPPDADGHFIKLPADLAGAADAELSAELTRHDG
jgi:transketolase